MSKTSVDADAALMQRCKSILHEKGEAMDCLQMSRLLREDSSACYRAMCAITGIELTGMGMLQQFKLPK